MPIKRVLSPQRLRRVPSQFSWVDHRLVRDRHICRCSAQALALYLFLVTVADGFVAEMKKYLKPDLLVLDELGYLPIDKRGADLLFQIISQRYERGALVLTANKAFKHWPAIFNNDSSLTSALLDRLLHHAETIIIQGKSYRMKDR